MAIKKGAFEQYANEGRRLPSKDINSPKKRTHIFNLSEDDGIEKTDHNKTVTVQKRFTLNNAIPNDSTESIDDNGSQTVHKRFTLSKATLNDFDEFIDNNGSQTVHKQFDQPFCVSIRYRDLSESSKKIVRFFYKSIKRNKSNVTEELNLDMIATYSNVPKSSLKNTLFRLRKQNVIQTVHQKEGRGGWVIYSILQSIYYELDK